MSVDCLMSACRDGDVAAVVNHLQTHDVNVTQAGSSVLHQAVICGHVDMVSLLLSHPHIDPNMVDGAGMTPLHLACSQGRDKLVRLLGN